MFGPKFSPSKQLTLCPSGLRGWTQVPLVQTAWVQIPQVSYGPTPALPPPQQNKVWLQQACSRPQKLLAQAELSEACHSQSRHSSPCGQSPLDFESNSLAARTQCLLLAKTCVFQHEKEGAAPSTCSWCHERFFPFLLCRALDMSAVLEQGLEP